MFDFDFGLGDDVDLLRESVAAFASDKIAPRAQAIDSENKFPRVLWPDLGAMGLLGITECAAVELASPRRCEQ